MEIRFKDDDISLSATQFVDLALRVWPGHYDVDRMSEALARTLNITAWNGDLLVGCVRVLSDGYLFGTIPEVMVDPAYRGRGVGRKLMELAWGRSPTSIFLGAQPGNEGFFERLGFEPGMASYVKRKPRQI